MFKNNILELLLIFVNTFLEGKTAHKNIFQVCIRTIFNAVILKRMTYSDVTLPRNAGPGLCDLSFSRRPALIWPKEVCELAHYIAHKTPIPLVILVLNYRNFYELPPESAENIICRNIQNAMIIFVKLITICVKYE